MARKISRGLLGGWRRGRTLRRFSRRALVLLLVTVSANPASIWADPNTSTFTWRSPAVAPADAASDGPELASPNGNSAAPNAKLAAPAGNNSAATRAAATPASDGGKLRWRQAPVKQESGPALSTRETAKQVAAKQELAERLTIKLEAATQEEMPQTTSTGPAAPERFAPAPPAKRFHRAPTPPTRDEEVIRLTVGAEPAASSPEDETFRVRAAVADEPATLSDEPISNFETRTRTRTQVLGVGGETRVRFAPQQTGAPDREPSRAKYSEETRAQYIAQQPRSRTRSGQAPQEPAPSGAAEAPPNSLPPTDNFQSTDRFQPTEPAPGDAMSPSAEMPNAEMPNAEFPDPPLNLPGDSALPPNPDFSPFSPRPDLYGEPGPSDSSVTPPPPTAQEALEPLPCEGDKNGCVSALEKLQANTIDHIALEIRISGDEGRDFPCECTFGDQKFAWREWSSTVYTFKANGQCHKPMYFEDVQLERYGHSWNPLLQPVLSGAHFYLNVLLLPYHMGVYPPNECIYTLGYYRPGSCAPFVIEPFPLSVKGALFEGSAIFTGAWVWGFFAP